MRISVIIPVRNGGAAFERCLARLSPSLSESVECVVVDDASTDNSASAALRSGCRVFSVPECRGPAAARNVGAARARGAILLFLDADVCVRADTVQRIADFFQQHPEMQAVIGGYDDAPFEKNFCSQYRNLMHFFVHQTSSRKAVSFWTGCGAVRREAFFGVGGFDERYRHASMEDVDFGYRLIRAGNKITLDHHLLVTHLKRWDLFPMLSTDIVHRGIPWTRLILRHRRMPDDLNLKWSQRWSVVTAWSILLLLALAVANAEGLNTFPAGLVAVALACATIMLLALNRAFYFFLIGKRGFAFAAAAVALHFCFHALNGVSLAAGITAHVCASTPKGPVPEPATRSVINLT